MLSLDSLLQEGILGILLNGMSKVILTRDGISILNQINKEIQFSFLLMAAATTILV